MFLTYPVLVNLMDCVHHFNVPNMWDINFMYKKYICSCLSQSSVPHSVDLHDHPISVFTLFYINSLNIRSINVPYISTCWHEIKYH